MKTKQQQRLSFENMSNEDLLNRIKAAPSGSILLKTLQDEYKKRQGQWAEIDESEVEGEDLEGHDKNTRERINEDINNNLRGSKGQWLGDPKDDWLTEKNTLKYYDKESKNFGNHGMWSDQDLLDELKEDVPYQFQTMIRAELHKRAEAKSAIIDYDGDGLITDTDRDIHAELRNSQGHWIASGTDPDMDEFQDELDKKSEQDYEAAKIEARKYINDISQLISSALDADDLASGQQLLNDARGLLELLRGVNDKVGIV